MSNFQCQIDPQAKESFFLIFNLLTPLTGLSFNACGLMGQDDGGFDLVAMLSTGASSAGAASLALSQ